MNDFSYIFNAHPSYIDSLYKTYLDSPETIDQGWRTFFEGFDFASKSGSSNGYEAVREGGNFVKELGVLKLIYAFRTRGHLLSTTNPIRQRKDRRPHLDLADYNLSEEDLNQVFHAAQVVGLQNVTLSELIAHLKLVYCGNIGVEFMHIENMEQRYWIRDQMEKAAVKEYYGFEVEKKKRILSKLNGAAMFEKFLHTKYVGQKRFSLEGGETTIAALDATINKGAELGVEEVIIGMAHRGRLNVLANIMGKTYEQIFNEFEGTAVPDLSYGDGDVKYHLGYSSMVDTPSGKTVHLKLTPNPSHLESVNPVVEGFARAKADILYNSDFDKILPVLIHGDAALAGQGVVYEVIQMSKLKGYYTGGTLHFVINNQIGFTTDFDDARSSTYCTGLANAINAPVFHVNGDDPEAVVYAIELATEYRQKFNVDVFIDMVCYRRHGHNEGDDPKFTQPEMYTLISKHPDPREIYISSLVNRGSIEQELANSMEKAFWDDLQARLDHVKEKSLPYKYQEPERAWRALTKHATQKHFEKSPDTGIAAESVDKILTHLATIPADFSPLGKISRLMSSSKKLLDDNKLDWQMGELLAYGSILLEEKDVRFSGQDVKRGTFSHRHAVFYDSNDYRELNRLDGIADKQGKFRIYNSLLSEFAVLGFEYGYSMASPNTLVIWEAQFGDFYNGAQVIVDQYLAAGQSKWQRMSGLVMLLPHGYEGQGPEHSSARLERFLQLCANLNMVVINPTTPANMFHAHRRQLQWEFRKPLIVMSPKSLLRHPLCVSAREDFHKGKRFQEVIDDTTVSSKQAKNVKRILFCSGKVFYGLLQKKEELKREDVAIVRIEQLYPLAVTQIQKIVEKYKGAEKVWVQEESMNMGAWSHMVVNHPGLFDKLISRKASASPATGYKKVHDEQEANLFASAFE